MKKITYDKTVKKKRSYNDAFYCEDSSLDKTGKKYTQKDFSLQLLNTEKEHHDFLLKSIDGAKNHLLITSYNFKDEKDVITALKNAVARNVKVYLYFNDFLISERYLDFLEKTGIKLCDMDIHSKIVSADNKFIAIGSYNWLSGDKNIDQTVVYTGKNVQEIKQNLWDLIKDYTKISDDDVPEWHLLKLNKILDKKIPYMLVKNMKDTISVLITPKQHQDFLRNCFKTAKHNITITVPFITKCENFLRDIIKETQMEYFLAQDKKLKIIYRVNDHDIHLLQERLLLDVPSSKNIIWEPALKIHKKTILVDDNLVTVGSFNWFSSARDLIDDFRFMKQLLYSRENVLNGYKLDME